MSNTDPADVSTDYEYSLRSLVLADHRLGVIKDDLERISEGITRGEVDPVKVMPALIEALSSAVAGTRIALKRIHTLETGRGIYEDRNSDVGF
jgi:hypothetical protein